LNRTTLITIIIVAAAVLLVMTGILFLRQYTPKYRWYPDLKSTSNEPYGMSNLYEIVKNSYPKNKFVLVNQSFSSVINDNETNSLLFYCGYNTYYDTLTIEWLKNYLYRGNKICIASTNLPQELLNKLFNVDSSYYYTGSITDSVITTRFYSDSLKTYNFHYQILKKKSNVGWPYLSDATIKFYWGNSNYELLSEIDSGYVNFLKVSCGHGELFIYTSPVLLTNYYITAPEGFGYAEQFFKTIGKTDKFYWDNFSKDAGFDYTSSEANPIEFILSNKELRLAWYLLMTGIVLFAVFRLKRRQQPINVVLPDKNTSIEYAKAVGLLHFNNANHSELANQQMKLFFAFIKNRYKITLSKDYETQRQQVALHSGIDRKIIDTLFSEYYMIKFNPEPEKVQAINLHSLLEYFYKNCK
jgi:hypothetical protein